MNPKAREHRFRRLREIGCIACWMRGDLGVPPEIHHLNLGGKAGQKRRGDEFTIPLCRWHHQADKGLYQTAEAARVDIGPSLKLHSRAFRETYGSDDFLLVKVNGIIFQLDELAYATRPEAERLPNG